MYHISGKTMLQKTQHIQVQIHQTLFRVYDTKDVNLSDQPLGFYELRQGNKGTRYTRQKTKVNKTKD